MPARKSTRSKKAVSYVSTDTKDDDVDHTTATTSNDPDFTAEIEVISETDEVETEKENLPAKKRKTIHDFMSPSAKIKPITESSPVTLGELPQPNTASSSQLSRLDELQKVMTERGRSSLVGNQCDRSDESFTGILSSIKNVRAKGTKLRTPSSAKTPTGKGAKGKIDGNTVEQWRRQLGNSCKANISFEKWTIAARTHFTTDFTLGAFRALIVPNASKVHPADFDSSTPVVTASSRKPGVIFGSSKCKGGSRFGSFSAEEAEFIFVASTKQLSVWWTMG
ncbi:uncharacterized protein LOC134812514 [Bolinopsis microptera]|uniref:uncharacterized protein LOC134812514 n=1 Tax=Bolinopsis microptera TaxID=2820187 RepID=UPI00307994D8